MNMPQFIPFTGFGIVSYFGLGKYVTNIFTMSYDDKHLLLLSIHSWLKVLI